MSVTDGSTFLSEETHHAPGRRSPMYRVARSREGRTVSRGLEARVSGGTEGASPSVSAIMRQRILKRAYEVVSPTGRGALDVEGLPADALAHYGDTYERSS
jgi:hypothetical protein